MRRFFTSIFAVYYLAIASGVTVHTHYCMGEMASMSFFFPPKNPCPCGEKGEMPGCCKHVVLKAKTDKAQQPALESLPVAPGGMFDLAMPVAPVILYRRASDTVLLPLFEIIRSCKTIPFYLLFGVLRN